jgi:uncharacterized cupredoxin-like copper-binding protein
MLNIWNTLKAAAVFSCVITVSGTALAAGNLAANATRLPDLEINSAELSFSQTSFELETGKYYRWRIVHDGGEELAVIAPDLFRNSWINQVIINDLEITPYGLHSVEFDDEGIIDIWFVPIRPGEYEFAADGYESRGMVGTFVVK